MRITQCILPNGYKHNNINSVPGGWHWRRLPSLPSLSFPRLIGNASDDVGFAKSTCTNVAPCKKLSIVQKSHAMSLQPLLRIRSRHSPTRPMGCHCHSPMYSNGIPSRAPVALAMSLHSPSPCSLLSLTSCHCCQRTCERSLGWHCAVPSSQGKATVITTRWVT